MQLTGKDIEKKCNRLRLIRGKALYASKAVEGISVIDQEKEVRAWIDNHAIEWNPEEDMQGKYAVEAKVVGSTGNEYKVELLIDEKAEDKFAYYYCDCLDYGENEMFCKHCVAVSHNLVMKELEERLAGHLVSSSQLEQNAEETGQTGRSTSFLTHNLGVAKDPKGRYSSSTVMQLIKTYSNTDISSMWKQNDQADVTVLPGSVVLEPNLVVDKYKEVMIEFRIGTDRKKYVLKDIGAFRDMMQEGAYYSYGKQLAFEHKRELFSEDSFYYIDMIEDLKSISASGYVYEVAQSNRYLRLSSGYVEQMLLNNVGKKLKINGASCLVSDKNPKIQLFIEKAEHGANIALKSYHLIHGLSRDFYLDETARCVYAVSRGFQKKAIPFLYTMQEYRDYNFYSMRAQQNEYKCFLDERDYISFCGHVLRNVESYFEVVEEKLNLQAYMPEECKIKIYLDTSEENQVTCNLKACYGQETYNLADWTRQNEGDFRDLEVEQQAYQIARQYFPNDLRLGEEYFITSHDEDNLYELLEHGLIKLREVGEVYVSDAMHALKIKKPPKLTAGVQVKGNLLSLSVDIPDMSNEEIGEVLAAYRMKKKYYRLKNGDFMQLKHSGFGTLSHLSEDLGMEEMDWKDGEIQMPLFRASFVDSMLKSQGSHLNLVRSSEFRSIIRDMKEVEDSDYEVPKSIQATLRDYQKTGYRWLRTLAHYGFGGILADDMGLGKTLQVITLLQSVVEEDGYDKKKETALIVCPASLVYNWESEFAKFAPELRVRVVVGAASVRKKKLASLRHVDVVVTSYDLLKRDLESYQGIDFSYMIVDEAQYIKNASTQVARAVKGISSKVRFALTGTPLENRLSDLWSIFDFIMHGYLYSYEKFRNNYETFIVAEQDKDVLERLQKMISPFILRRRKAEVLTELPDKIENVVYTSMTDAQKKYYHARFIKLKRELEDKSEEEWKSQKIEVLAELTRLRQLCCDPALFVDGYTGGSGKVDAFLTMVEELTANGSNILVFSQFATMLEQLKASLEEKEIHTLILTGKTSKEERRRLVEEFQEGTATVFLISLKAGGTGLNLTAADTVIHFDPWWNVAAQNQATDRAHRIGQEKVVTVMQLVTKHSIEERIIELQNKKKELVEQVIEGDAVASATLTKEEILGLLEDFT